MRSTLACLIVPAAILFLPGCGRDPAVEAPVKMLPGMYEISLPGSVLDGLEGPGTRDKRRCLTAGEEEMFPRIVLRPLLEIEGCTSADFDRKGNLLTGSAVCPIDPQQGSGEWELATEATISEDRFDASLEFKLDPDQVNDPEAQQGLKMIQAVQKAGLIRLSAKRVGDC